MKTYNSALVFKDVRRITFESRVKIGFSPEDSWRDAEATFDAHTLTIQGHPVMEDWDDTYMQELALIASMRKGAVLEVGYGMGISARYIQKNNPERHIIIEANRSVFERLCAATRKTTTTVEPLFGFWQDVTKEVIPDGSLSGILFDTYPMHKEEIHQNHFSFFTEAYRMLKLGGVLTYYSDEIKDFSPAHMKLLMDAGFTHIDKKICKVSPPKGCLYWKSNTIVAPIITK